MEYAIILLYTVLNSNDTPRSTKTISSYAFRRASCTVHNLFDSWTPLRLKSHLSSSGLVPGSRLMSVPHLGIEPTTLLIREQFFNHCPHLSPLYFDTVAGFKLEIRHFSEVKERKYKKQKPFSKIACSLEPC